MRFTLDEITSPIGAIRVVAQGDVIYSLDFADYEERMTYLLRKRYGQVELRLQAGAGGVKPLLEAYFAGDMEAFSQAKCLAEGSDFQERVWSELCTIPAGTTRSYAELAAMAGKPKAIRAVGAINAQNPIAIIIPCHRVIAKGGKLSGYAGGVERKRWLLEHEAKYAKKAV